MVKMNYFHNQLMMKKEEEKLIFLPYIKYYQQEIFYKVNNNWINLARGQFTSR